jgi:hypothetical protein
MKKLMTEWREFLKEGLDPRIQKQLNALLERENLGIVLSVFAGGDGAEVRYVKIEDYENEQFSDLKEGAAVYGGVEISRALEDEQGPCFDGHLVIGSRAERGWGPLLYEVALEWASQNGGGLMPDRFSVSDYALAVWSKYEKRSDVKPSQMEVAHGLDGISSRTLDYFPQLTPDKKEDDCDQTVPIGRRSTDWPKSPLSKIYSKSSADTIKALQKAKRLIVV